MKQKFKKPPITAAWLFQKFLPKPDDVYLKGDFDEIYNDIFQDNGRIAAWFWYWMQLINSIIPIMLNSVTLNYSIYINYFKITIRNIKQHKVFAFINIFGLSLGIASCILIVLWVQDELSFDTFHKNSDNLHRIIARHRISGLEEITVSSMPDPLALTLKSRFPEIIEASRYTNHGKRMVSCGDLKFYETSIGFADPTFLKMFSFELISGNPKTAISNPFSILITEEMQDKYFGNNNAMGQTLQIAGKYEFTVTGILKDLPSNSSIRFDFLVPFVHQVELAGISELGDWQHDYCYTYLLLKDNKSAAGLEQKMKSVLEAKRTMKITLYLQPVKKMHLYGTGASTKYMYVYIFSVIAAFILLIAIINYMNLSTSQSSIRAKEVGIRKVAGAQKRELICQFYTESIITTLIANVFALCLVVISLKYFNTLTAKQIILYRILDFNIISGLLMITFITIFLTGSYPAIILSSFQAVTVLKGSVSRGLKSGNFRKVLVTFQFFLSVMLIIGTLVIKNQLEFINKRNLGFDKESVICINTKGNLSGNYETFRKKIVNNSCFSGVTCASNPPSSIWSSFSDVDWEGKTEDQIVDLFLLSVDYDYLETFNIKLLHGRKFSREMILDGNNVIMNEKAARLLGEKKAVGKRFQFWDKNGQVIGVVKDFHFHSLHHQIKPLIINILPKRNRYIFVKIRPGFNLNETIGKLEKIWKTFKPGFPLDFTFLDESIEARYRSEFQTGKIFYCFTVLALFIACLGLFGLVSYSAEQRKKEIGVRKVLGASVLNIVQMISKEYVILIIFANLAAWSAAYYFMKKWLDNFAFRSDLTVSMFLFTGFFTFFIALLTVSYHSFRAATANPVESIGNE